MALLASKERGRRASAMTFSTGHLMWRRLTRRLPTNMRFLGQKVLLVQILDKLPVNLARNGDVVIEPGFGGEKVVDEFLSCSRSENESASRTGCRTGRRRRKAPWRNSGGQLPKASTNLSTSKYSGATRAPAGRCCPQSLSARQKDQVLDPVRMKGGEHARSSSAHAITENAGAARTPVRSRR